MFGGIRRAAFGILLTSSIVYAQSFGTFTGSLIFQWLPDGRNMRLTVPFGYIDPGGRTWDVPPGSETDGASIPRVLWTLAGPFEGKHRDAAVIHDYYCQTRIRPWRETHLTFYNAMRAAGVSEVQAKWMYGAVYYFGPRWGIGTASRGPGGEQALSPEQQQEFVANLREWIERDAPDLSEISRRLDSGDGLPAR